MINYFWLLIFLARQFLSSSLLHSAAVVAAAEQRVRGSRKLADWGFQPGEVALCISSGFSLDGNNQPTRSGRCNTKVLLFQKLVRMSLFSSTPFATLNLWFAKLFTQYIQQTILYPNNILEFIKYIIMNQ